MQVWRGGSNPVHGLGDRVDQMLAIVEKEQHALVAEIRDKRLREAIGMNRDAERGRQGAGYEAWVTQGFQVDQPHPVGILVQGGFRGGNRHGRFADAAGSDDGDQRVLGKETQNRLDRIDAPDHARGGDRQVVDAPLAGAGIQRGGRCGNPTHGSDKSISPAAGRGDVAGARGVLTKGPPKRRDIDLQIARFHKGIGPDACQNLIFADNFARPFHQDG